jgi:hypothetical protein
MILSNFEWTLLRSNIYWWLVFLLIVPLKALANCQKSYWCITSVNNAGNACIAGVIDTGKDMQVGDLYCPVSTTPALHDVTGVNGASKECIAGVIDTGDFMHHRCH